MYIVPVLNDPNTGTLIKESLEIAAYLDETYPAKPIFPHGSKMLICVFDFAYLDGAHPIVRLILVRTAEILNPVSEEFFLGRAQRDCSFLGKSFHPRVRSATEIGRV